MEKYLKENTFLSIYGGNVAIKSYSIFINRMFYLDQILISSFVKINVIREKQPVLQVDLIFVFGIGVSKLS